MGEWASGPLIGRARLPNGRNILPATLICRADRDQRQYARRAVGPTAFTAPSTYPKPIQSSARIVARWWRVLEPRLGGL